MFAFLARLILFLIAISVIRSVVSFVQRALGGIMQGSIKSPAGRRAPTASSAATTMLQQDPVCGTYVAVDSSLKRIVAGRVVHFCSAECRDKYGA